MKAKCPSSTQLHSSLSAPSAARNAVIGNYMCSFGAFAKGAYGALFGGVDIEGNVVAIKRFLKPKKAELEEHRRILKKLGINPNILRLIDTFWDFNLREILGNYIISIEAMVILFRDWVRAIKYLKEDLKRLVSGYATHDDEEDRPDAADIQRKQENDHVTRERHRVYMDQMTNEVKAMGNTKLQKGFIRLCTSMASYVSTSRPTAQKAYTMADRLCKNDLAKDAMITPKVGIKRARRDSSEFA
ncbi:MAG: hypothetical protein Q9218_003971 [Villophora microphyllina]